MSKNAEKQSFPHIRFTGATRQNSHMKAGQMLQQCICHIVDNPVTCYVSCNGYQNHLR